MDWLSFVQWPAMAVTIGAAWMAGSQRKMPRMFGFWAFLLSNLLWIVWGWHAEAYALILLQIFLVATNIRGAKKNETDNPEEV